MTRTINNGIKMVARNNKGQFLRGGSPGRPKGAKDKIARSIKESFDYVYEKLGGDEDFLSWVKKSARNKELFYQWRSKMLPSNLDIGGQFSINYELSDKFLPKIGNEKK